MKIKKKKTKSNYTECAYARGEKRNSAVITLFHNQIKHHGTLANLSKSSRTTPAFSAAGSAGALMKTYFNNPRNRWRSEKRPSDFSPQTGPTQIPVKSENFKVEERVASGRRSMDSDTVQFSTLFSSFSFPVLKFQVCARSVYVFAFRAGIDCRRKWLSRCSVSDGYLRNDLTWDILEVVLCLLLGKIANVSSQ